MPSTKQAKTADGLPNLVHHRATGRARFRYRRQDFYVGPWDVERDEPSPEAVENARYEWKRICEGTHPRLVSPRRHEVATVRQAAIAYIEDIDASGRHRKQSGRVTSERSLIQQAMRRLVSAHGDVRLRDYTTAHLRQLQRSLIKPTAKWTTANGGTQKRTEPLTTRTANLYTAGIMRFFKWAELEGYAPEGTYGKLSLVPMLEAGAYGSKRSAGARGGGTR